MTAWTLVLFAFRVMAQTSVPDGLDGCALSRDEGHKLAVSVAASLTRQHIMRKSPFQVRTEPTHEMLLSLMDLQQLKGRCVYRVLSEAIGPKLLVKQVEQFAHARRAMISAAIHEGRMRAKLSSSSDTPCLKLQHPPTQIKCIKKRLAEHLSLNAVVYGIESFFSDVDQARRLDAPVTFEQLQP